MAEPEKKVVKRSKTGLWIGLTFLIIFLAMIIYFVVLDKGFGNNKVNRNIANLMRKYN
jgi:hypothetical protein